MKMPRKIENTIAQMITSSAVWAPQITRDSTSKPLTVVPRRFVAFGGCCVPKSWPFTDCCAQLYGARSGAKIAVRMNRLSSTRPAMSIPRWRPMLCRSCETTGMRSASGRLRGADTVAISTSLAGR